jgi:predicted Zn finger-like uncharacterized protein
VPIVGADLLESINCPECNYEFQVPEETLFTDGAVIECPRCHEKFEIKHDMTELNQQIDDELNEFGDQIEDIFKKG